MECGCIRGQCTCKVLGYEDYKNFSTFAITASIDETMADIAKQLAHQQARGIKELYDAVHEPVD
jgi:hypothetical protein